MQNIKVGIKDAIDVIFIYLALGIGLTVISLFASPIEAKIGTFRPILQIPTHELDLFAISMIISFLAILANKKFDFSLLLLPPIFVIFLDIDHFPSAFGISQPIRPAHSFFFMALFIASLIMLKKPASICILALSSFFGHLVVDSGVFALLAPFSFSYISLAAIKPELLIITLGLALLAGYTYRSRYSKATLFATGKE